MKCEYQRQIDDFVRNKLTEGKAGEFKEHLKGCASCRNEVELLQKVKFTLKHKPLFPLARMTQSGGAPEKDIDVVDKIMKEIQTQKSEKINLRELLQTNKTKEVVHLVVKYFIMEHRHEELNHLNIFFDDLYKSVTARFSPEPKFEPRRQAALRSKGKNIQKLTGLQIIIETTYLIIQTILTQQLETEKKPLGILEATANSLSQTGKERKLVNDLIKIIRRVYFG